MTTRQTSFRVSMTTRVAPLLLVLVLAGARPAMATETGEASDPGGSAASPPTLLHTPPSDAQPGAPLLLKAVLEGAWLTTDVTVWYRPLTLEEAPGPWESAPLRRAVEGAYQATIPQPVVGYPGFEYYVASRLADGSTRLHFASPAAPHRVVVLRDSSEQRHERRLAHHDGQIHSAGARAHFVWFGERTKTIAAEFSDSGQEEKRSFHDWFVHAEALYTYRLLGIIYEISFGAGTVRGEGELHGWARPDASVRKPGIDYGVAGVRFAFLDWLSLKVNLRLGADEEGFSGGTGGFVTVGKPVGTHLDLGADWTYRVGFRAFLEFTWDTVPHCLMSLRAEISNWPDEERIGTMATYNLKARVHRNVELGVSLGFASRHGAAEGGVVAGLGITGHF